MKKTNPQKPKVNTNTNANTNIKKYPSQNFKTFWDTKL